MIDWQESLHLTEFTRLTVAFLSYQRPTRLVVPAESERTQMASRIDFHGCHWHTTRSSSAGHVLQLEEKLRSHVARPSTNTRR